MRDNNVFEVTTNKILTKTHYKMSKVIKLKKGLDILLKGEADKIVVQSLAPQTYGIVPMDFIGLTPKLLVKVDDKVKAGTPIMFDKYRPNLLFVSPVSGTIKEIVRGEKRKILEILVTPDKDQVYEKYEIPSLNSIDVSSIKELMLKSGLWPMVIQRPYGVIASENDTPRAIYVSLFDSSPLAGDLDVMIDNYKNDFEEGLKILKKLSNGKLFVGVSQSTNKSIVEMVSKYATVNTFSHRHPAGCVGVQIANTAPISKGEVLWTVSAQSISIIGRFFTKGEVDMRKIVVLAGSEVIAPKYYRTIVGASISSIASDDKIKKQPQGDSVRVINGNVLNGTKTSLNGYLGFYNNLITIIPEGDKYEMLGWIAPRFNKFSVSRSYFSWLMPSKHYRLDTNQNGGQRAFVMNNEYEKVVPMDIYPVYLLKAILANDIDKMENLGIYEVIEEDLALCEFVCTSKIDVQDILRQGINSMIKELN